MSQVNCLQWENPLESKYGTSVCDQHTLSKFDTQKASSFDSYYSKLKFYFWLQLRIYVKT